MNLNEDAFQACTRAKQLHSGSPVILYGSYARGDANAESDIDVLLVGSGQYRRWNEGKVSFSYYPRPLLSFLFESGSLFALHLQKDGIVFDDPSGEYQGVASRFLAQDDYLHLMVDLVTLANALDVTQLQYNQA